MMLNENDGALLQRKYVVNGMTKNKIDYEGDKEWHNDTLEYVHHAHGRVIKHGSLFEYEYKLADHLGNTRVTFTDSNNDNAITSTERRSAVDYYAFGLEHYSQRSESEYDVSQNLYRYNGNENIPYMSSGLMDFNARMYSPELGRFFHIDALAFETPQVSGFSFSNNNPISYSDPTGYKVDSTRIYQVSGQYMFTINDDSPNEDHFMTIEQLKTMFAQKFSNVTEFSEYARKASEFFIGSGTRQQLKEITAVSNSLQKEQGFVLTKGSDRQLNVTNISKYADVSSSQIREMDTAIKDSGIKGIVGVGHTHPNIAPSEHPAPFPSDAYLKGKSLSDYSPLMYNPYDQNKYGGNLSIVSARNGFTIYTNAYFPNSYTNYPVVFSTYPTVLQSFKGKRF